MEIGVILLLLGLFLIGFKVLGLIFKASFFILSIPFQILGAIFGVILLTLLLPFAAVAGVLTVVVAPLFILGPLLPALLVFFGFYLILKS